MLVERSFRVAINNDGRGSIVVNNLLSGVRYELKVRIMGMDSDKSTQNSNEKNASTI
jgi:hypothetical protein